MPGGVSLRTGTDRAVALLARLISRGLFRSVEVVGFDDLPTGPRLIVANHFNGFVDPVVLAGALGRLPRFIAKATLWKTPGVPLLMRAVGVLPVHRTVDGGGDNAGTFRSVIAELHHGHAVAIFPEGTTHDDQRLAPVRTGAARLALDAAADGVDLAIVPVGITFEDKVALRSRVVVRAAPPIDPAGASYLDPGGAPVGSEDHRVHVAARARPVSGDGDVQVGEPVQGGPHAGVGLHHEGGDGLHVVPRADPVVDGLDVCREAGAEPVPVPAIDAGGIGHQHLGDVVLVVSAHLVLRVRGGSGARISPPPP